MTNNLETRQITISGRVQGVGFRNWVKKNCTNLSLVGNVRNTLDMKVEVITTGFKANLDKFCDKCQSGPTLAEVESVNIKAINLKEFSSFKIIY
jgi:acylphosphatase